jgi:hypothetical protein
MTVRPAWVAIPQFGPFLESAKSRDLAIDFRMMSSSFWYQLEETVRGTVAEPPVVLAIKFLLWGTCVLALLFSFHRVLRDRG